MPLPEPEKNESVSAFVKRCMADDVMNKEFPDTKERAAVCYNQHRQAKKQ